MSNNESLCSVHINKDVVSCVQSSTNVTSTTQGYLIRIRRKAFCVRWLYNTIIKKLSNYGGVAENTYILCVDLEVLDKISDNFSIHGGWTPESAGCIDMTSNIKNFVALFEFVGKDLIVEVKY